MKTVEAETITKKYGEDVALRDASFHADRGEILGFIGPDGAGKTTLFRILVTLLTADSGRARILGFDTVKDYRSIRKCVGYMPGKFSLYQDLTVEENLNFFATIFGTTVGENYHLIRDIYIQIEPFRKRRAGALSGGMKQKLALSCALIHKPEVLFLDEPTTGVDAVSRKEFWEMLQNLKSSGITILVSTPYMDEAKLCDRVALIQSGAIMQIDTPDDIISGFGRTVFSVESERTHHLIRDLEALPQCESAYPFGQSVHFMTHGDLADEEGVREYLRIKGHTAAQLHAIVPDIEDCFIYLMQKKA